MSGLVGIWNTNGQPVDRELLARLNATLAHRGPDGAAQWQAGPVGFACQLSRVTPESVNETQPLRDASGAALLFDGRLDNREELLARLDDAGLSRDASDPAFVLAAYRAAGEELPSWLNGDFALAVFDAPRRRLLLARDAIGIRPLYYWRGRDTIVFASEIKAILAHPAVQTQPNDDLLADVLLDRIHDQELTFFTNIFSVLPAHRIVITPQGIRQDRYWDFDVRRQLRLDSFRAYTEAFRDVFETAVRRRLRSRHPVAVSVSGGLDSSSIVCLGLQLLRRGRAAAPSLAGVSYVTPAGSPSDESSYLRAMESQYGVEILRVPMQPGGYLEGARTAVWHIETPFLDEQWATNDRCMARIRSLGARTVLTGHWGDQVLFPQAYLVDLARQGAWGLVASHLREFPRWLTDVPPSYFRRAFLIELVKHSLPTPLFMLARWLRYGRRQGRGWYAAGLRRRARRRQWRKPPLGRGAATAHARELYEQARTGYHVMCMEWDNKMAALYGLEMAFPYLDRELLSFVMAAPGAMLNHRGVPRALLREALRDVLPEAIAQRRWKADVTHMVNASSRASFDDLVRCVASGREAMRRGYVDAEGFRAQVETLRAGLDTDTAEAAWAVSDLVGLELWLQTFFHGGVHGQADESQEALPAAAA